MDVQLWFVAEVQLLAPRVVITQLAAVLTDAEEHVMELAPLAQFVIKNNVARQIVAEKDAVIQMVAEELAKAYALPGILATLKPANV